MADENGWLSFLTKFSVTDNVKKLSRYTCLLLFLFFGCRYVLVGILCYNVPHHELNLRPWMINLRKECDSVHPPTTPSTSIVTASVITQAATFPQSEVLKFIIDHARGEVNMQTSNGWAALHFACYYNQYDNVLLLCYHGANVNLKTSSGQTPLHISVSLTSTNIARSLIIFGADRNAKDKAGDTPLHLAASLGNVASCKLLVNVGAEIDSENQLKQTPLIRAVRSRQKEAAVYLIKRGAKWGTLIQPDEKNKTYFDRFHVSRDFLNSINEAAMRLDVRHDF